MRTITINNHLASAQTRSWLVDEDSRIVALQIIGTDAVVSFEPDLTTASAVAPTDPTVQDSFRIYLSSVSGFTITGVNFPLQKDRRLFVSFSAVGRVFLYLENSAENPVF
jgi:hypothetical protein